MAGMPGGLTMKRVPPGLQHLLVGAAQRFAGGRCKFRERAVHGGDVVDVLESRDRQHRRPSLRSAHQANLRRSTRRAMNTMREIAPQHPACNWSALGDSGCQMRAARRRPAGTRAAGTRNPQRRPRLVSHRGCVFQSSPHERCALLFWLLWLSPAAGGGNRVDAHHEFPRNRQSRQPGGFFLHPRKAVPGTTTD